ncbi:hypothetical protein C8A00DRAFT_45712 [Chaetomidium leptoderma]|uniref:Uncharacterized protein n=1 Tax=Chaetomidium leptoderma TaxID=669021 RepID=A0AAN6VIV9_9PEZI|nr:hypothetical protein C8A00DRAFT_45712 [Chaetomidium leptoderma]
MDFPTSLLDCLCGSNNPQPDHSNNHPGYTLITEKPAPEPLPSTTSWAPTNDNDDNDNDELTTRTTTKKILTPPLPCPKEKSEPHPTHHHQTEHLLHSLEDILKTPGGEHTTPTSWGEAFTDAYTHAVASAQQALGALWAYARAHSYEIAASVLLTVLALGVLARLVPGFVRVLGFGGLGGSFAAWWQRLYGGYVPKGSLWSFLQRMGMTWE